MMKHPCRKYTNTLVIIASMGVPSYLNKIFIYDEKIKA